MKCAPQRLLVLVSILALVTAFVPSLTSAQPATDTTFLVSGSWVAQHATDTTVAIVDMRPSEAYDQGHIPGAINLPVQFLAQPNTDESQIAPWQDRMTGELGSVGITSNDMVVSYDDSGNLPAARMRWVLKYFGYENAAVLDGGLSAWTQLGEPLSTEPTSRLASTYTGTPNSDLLATWQYVLDRVDNPDVQILDVRPNGSYTGEAASTDLHSGHIPGALNLDWNNLVESQAPRTFKSVEALQASYDAIGLDRNKEIIVYCGSGIASSGALLSLDMLGYPRVRLYSASWAEWGNRLDLPFSTGPEPGA
jgi:thiosulfate/3-mercaptopyruvate sulfurtransferase